MALRDNLGMKYIEKIYATAFQIGTGITSTDGITVETIAENRKLTSSGDNTLTVNGTVKSSNIGWTENMASTSWVHLAGNVANSDIGYYFPGTTNVGGLRESRTGNWHQIDTNGTTPTTPYTNNFLNLSIDHGINPTNASYSYVVLPNKTSAQVSSYASNPNITILENSSDAQAVKENGLNLTGVNFWNDITKTVGNITSNKKAAIMTKDNGSNFEISVSDPTQANTGSISIEINKSASSTISSDPGVTITQLSPTIKLTINVNAAKGKAFKAKFGIGGVTPTPTATPTPTSTPTVTPTPTPTATPTPTGMPSLFECESLTTTASDTATDEIDGVCSNGKFSKLASNAVGDYIEYTINVSEVGTYRVYVKNKNYSYRGIYQLTIGGINQGSPVDQYVNGTTYSEDDLGLVTIGSTGNKLFRFTLTGKNASSLGYSLALDCIRLVKQ